MKKLSLLLLFSALCCFAVHAGPPNIVQAPDIPPGPGTPIGSWSMYHSSNGSVTVNLKKGERLGFYFMGGGTGAVTVSGTYVDHTGTYQVQSFSFELPNESVYINRMISDPVSSDASWQVNWNGHGSSYCHLSIEKYYAM